MLSDLRLAVRSLTKSPSPAAILIGAIGRAIDACAVARCLPRALWFALAVSFASPAAAESSAPPPDTARRETQLLQLTNGLRCIAAPMESPGEVTVLFYVATGYAHETASTRGATATLVELWRLESAELAARENLPVGFASSPDFASVRATWPAAKLADAMAFASAHWLRPDVARFIEARTNALAIRERWRKDGHWFFQQLCGVAFTTHPYRRSCYGDADELENLEPKGFGEHLATRLNGHNLILVVTGDFTPAELLPLLEREFNATPAGNAPARIDTDEPPQRGEKRVVLPNPPRAGFAIAFHKEPGARPTLGAWDVVLGVWRERCQQRTAALQAQVYWFETGQGPGMKHPNLAFALCVGKPEADIAALERIVVEEADRLAAEPLSAEELAAAKQRIVGGPEKPNARTRGQHLADWLAMTGDWRPSFAYRPTVRAVTAQQAQALARAVFRPENRTIVTTAEPVGISHSSR